MDPEHVVDVVGQLAEPLLALALGLLGAMAFGDIAEDDHHALDLALANL